MRIANLVIQVDLILPQECYELVLQKLVKEMAPPTFYRVVMTLGQVLDGAFFNEYIKTGQTSTGTPSGTKVY